MSTQPHQTPTSPSAASTRASWARQTRNLALADLQVDLALWRGTLAHLRDLSVEDRMVGALQALNVAAGTIIRADRLEAGDRPLQVASDPA